MMQINQNKTLWATWLMLVALALVPTVQVTRAGEGGEKGNGGDALTLEFYSLAKNAYFQVDSRRDLFPELDNASMEKWKVLIESTRLKALDKVTLDDNTEVGARNYPIVKEGDTARIEINRSKWAPLGMSLADKAALAFHEFLGLLGVYDGSNTGPYPLSGRYLTTFGPSYLVQESRYLPWSEISYAVSLQLQRILPGVRCIGNAGLNVYLDERYHRLINQHTGWQIFPSRAPLWTIKDFTDDCLLLTGPHGDSYKGRKVIGYPVFVSITSEVSPSMDLVSAFGDKHAPDRLSHLYFDWQWQPNGDPKEVSSDLVQTALSAVRYGEALECGQKIPNSEIYAPTRVSDDTDYYRCDSHVEVKAVYEHLKHHRRGLLQSIEVHYLFVK